MKWPTTKETHAYMKRRQQENVERSKTNRSEAWMAEKLKRTGLKWKPQAQWGYRLFDFWNALKGIAVEVDGLTHNEAYDAVRDRYNYERSGIVVIRVRNGNEADAHEALERIAALNTWNERREMLGLTPIRLGGRAASERGAQGPDNEGGGPAGR